jgi:transposase-like protein
MRSGLSFNSDDRKVDRKEAQAMRRVAPSTIIREEIGDLLAGGTSPETNILSALAQLGVRYVAQQGLEQEQTDHLGRGRYERGAGTMGRRNGYEEATLRTAEGGIGVKVPQVRDAEVPYRSKLIEFLAGNTEALDRLVVEMYARGLSTRDIEDAFGGPDGQLLLSRTAVSEITDRLWEDYQAFCAQDLSQIDVAYLFCDAIFESLRRYGAKEAILVCWCITTSGHKVLLHLAVGDKESELCWTEFFRHMIARGLRVPTSVTADGAPGLINAIGVCFGRSIRIRCWFHRMGNILAKVPEEGRAEVAAHLRAVRDAPTPESGRAAATDLVNRYGDAFPAAVTCFTEDLDALLGHLRLPARHRIFCRTTNLIERSFEEERRRTKVIPRFIDERSAMKLVFATLIRCAQRWSRVSITDIERHQLHLLRQELGIDPPPTMEEKEGRSRSSKRRKIA